MGKRLEKVKTLIDNIAYHNRLGSGDIEYLEWLIAQAEIANKVENILSCGDYDNQAKLDNINDLLTNEHSDQIA